MAGVDRISALPVEIKVSILSRLRITDAVRTSGLSRSWRHLWTLLPGFEADFNFAESPNLGTRTSRWEGIVGHLLSSLRGPIRHFSLKYPSRYHAWGLQSLLDFLFEKGAALEILLVHIGPEVQIQLPCFPLLKELDLCFVDLRLPTDFRGFDHLTTLKLFYVRMSQQDIQLLLDRSKKLTSFDCSELLPADEETGGRLSLTLNCPLLRDIHFEFKAFLAQARVVSAPCLKRASITTDILQPAHPDQLAWVAASTLRFLTDIAEVSHLTLSGCVLLSLSRVDLPRTFGVQFRQLRCLEFIGDMFTIDRRMYQVFCCMLRSMPLLESLELKCFGPSEERLHELDPIPPNEYTKKQCGFCCLDKTLRRVTIDVGKFTYIPDIMWLIRFILLNANVLELIEIPYCVPCWEDDGLESRIIEELCELEKTSSAAQVVLVDQFSASQLTTSSQLWALLL